MAESLLSLAWKRLFPFLGSSSHTGAHAARAMSTPSIPPGAEVATFANGCFWGTEHLYRQHFSNKGLLTAQVGFIGGKKDFPNPSYRQVCTGQTLSLIHI